MFTYTLVVVAIIRRDDGKYLICQRSRNSRYPLKWEFPGGKVEQGELPEDALKRELREELSIEGEIGSLIHEQATIYPDGGTFTVQFYAVNTWHGTIDNKVFADVRWLEAEELSVLDILDGNREVCSIVCASVLQRR